jgi:diaminopimelate epimerase
MMKNVIQRIAIGYPGGNATAIVLDNVTTMDKKWLNKMILRNWQLRFPDLPEIEQCCYVTEPVNQEAIARVEMFGGEFCVNAARSVVKLLAKPRGTGLIEVSGAQQPLQFALNKKEVTLYTPGLKMRYPMISIPEGVLVYLEGIVQLVVVDEITPPNLHEILEKLLKDKRYNLASEKCVGVSFYNPTTGRADFCVWVREVETIFDETACGSGTCAIGIVQAAAARTSVTLPVIQPSGETITAKVKYINDEIKNISISGGVKILYQGEFAL